MPEAQFDLMRQILAAPSPIGLEAAMTFGVLEPYFESFKPERWQIHRFRGNAGVVLDSHPGQDDMLSVMIVGHADKIRMQVRSIGKDGKIWINSDSFLPTTLIGHEVRLFCQPHEDGGAWRVLDGGTIEAIGAIHFADDKLRSGLSGVKPEMLYLELHSHGEKPQERIEALGIRPGDPIILHRPIRRGFSPDTFYGAYLDNGLGCFVTAEVARLVAEAGGLDRIRCLFAIASHEEIGRMGSRVMAGIFRPDVLIGVDVNHDLAAAPGVSARRYTPTAMGKGYTLTKGAITSPQLNAIIESASREREIPLQISVSGRDTGTDAMAGVFAAVDAAATSIGFPIRNMHTISEAGHTGDVLAAIYGIRAALEDMNEFNEGRGLSSADLRGGHPRLDHAPELTT
jgi:endoglucanase